MTNKNSNDSQIGTWWRNGSKVSRALAIAMTQAVLGQQKLIKQRYFINQRDNIAMKQNK